MAMVTDTSYGATSGPCLWFYLINQRRVLFGIFLLARLYMISRQRLSKTSDLKFGTSPGKMQHHHTMQTYWLIYLVCNVKLVHVKPAGFSIFFVPVETYTKCLSGGFDPGYSC